MLARTICCNEEPNKGNPRVLHVYLHRQSAGVKFTKAVCRHATVCADILIRKRCFSGFQQDKVCIIQHHNWRRVYQHLSVLASEQTTASSRCKTGVHVSAKRAFTRICWRVFGRLNGDDRKVPEEISDRRRCGIKAVTTFSQCPSKPVKASEPKSNSSELWTATGLLQQLWYEDSTPKRVRITVG